MRKRTMAAVGGAVVTVAVAATGVPAASAAPQAGHGLHVIRTLSSAYYGPLQFAVDRSGVYVADDFSATLNKIGTARPIAANPGRGKELAGVGVDAATGTIAYTTDTSTGEEGPHTAAAFTVLRPHRRPLTVDLFAYEKTHNPDGKTPYGVIGKVTPCVSKAFRQLGAPAQYRGQLDTHPYAVTSLGNGAWAIADAGANDILRVDANGAVSTLSVLPSQPLKITSGFAKQNGLPSCTVGVTYRFESVPTDVEVGPRGQLYATTLPGGAGVPGSVYALNSRGYSTARLVATGFVGATNLAISRSGHIFVANLYTGVISRALRGHAPIPVATLPAVAAIEWYGGHLYAATAPAVFAKGPGAPPKGSVVELGY